MDTLPQIDQLVATCDGVAVARVQMQNIIIVDAPADAAHPRKFINVQDGERMTSFLLNQTECRHLAHLLLNGMSAEPHEAAAPTTAPSNCGLQPDSTIASLVEHLMTAAFGRTRTPRSAPYQQGAEDTLKRLAYGSTSRRRYRAGTAEFDAYHSGAREGYAIWTAREAARSSEGDLKC